YSHAGASLLSEWDEQANRLAAYLFFAGEDSKSIESILTGPAESPEQHFLAGGWEGLIQEASTRKATLEELRRELLPRLERLIRDTSASPLNVARRVIIADYRVGPVFDPKRCAGMIAVDRLLDSGVWRVRVGPPSYGEGRH